jgi:biopolymer transport protein ExbD
MAGGAKFDEGDDDIITGINVTPLVDITLVLLIIFMVTASYIIAPQSIKVDLPKAKSGGPTGVATLAIALDKDGQLYLNGKKTDEDSVKAFIKAEVAAGHDLQAVISADKYTRHGLVVRVIDMVRQLGVSKFAISVDGG